jgi:hypothetical protein
MNFFGLLSIAFLLVFNLPNEIKTPDNRIQTNCDWLVGEWKRTNDEPGMVTKETWLKSNDTTYLGLGYTMKGNERVFEETMILILGSRLEVRMKGNTEPVIFRMTGNDANSFVVENPKNDFPKKIQYRKTKAGMSAVISDPNREVIFDFEPLK